MCRRRERAQSPAFCRKGWTLARVPGHDGGQQTSAFLAVTAKGEEAFRLAESAARHLIYPGMGHPAGLELRGHDGSKIDPRLVAARRAHDFDCWDHRLQLCRHLYADLECGGRDVRPDCRN